MGVMFYFTTLSVHPHAFQFDTLFNVPQFDMTFQADVLHQFSYKVKMI